MVEADLYQTVHNVLRDLEWLLLSMLGHHDDYMVKTLVGESLLYSCITFKLSGYFVSCVLAANTVNQRHMVICLTRYTST